jgi:hypothetical protein
MQNRPIEYATVWSGRRLPTGSAETLTLYPLRCTIHRNSPLQISTSEPQISRTITSLQHARKTSNDILRIR